MSPVAECLIAFVFGSVVGLLVQRSRFCNTAALRDAMLFKTFRNTKALLVAMMVLTIGFTGFISIGAGNPMRFDVGLNQVLGLFLFGTGMVLAGACTVSTWVKAGEGNFGAVWALLFTFIGMFLFSLIWSFLYWPPAPSAMTGELSLERLQLGFSNAETLQEKTGIPAIVFGLIQAAVLFYIYQAIKRKEAKQQGSAGVESI
ncbi:MAG: YeeE/YedE family protein [Proteobacteria bacterium]|nr:YeeE/YedE family protein [Pseudomonadota bacterium]MDB4825568.1 YeeE/YedE thiosulfate transporter family protein [Gammaproteobacteria bacterium]MBT4108425.1 YeeE/YedE family protein [Pseudomonadota bacterium]MBT5625460.1 YeeE/YedE family protein [Pseudomonadota bacterium]MBT6657924.1 YeeE/YedE family protein [Pseudomonadota bacterium]